MFSIIFSHSISPCEKDGQWFGKPCSRFTVPCQSQEKFLSKGLVYKTVLTCSICNWIRSMTTLTAILSLVTTAILAIA